MKYMLWNLGIWWSAVDVSNGITGCVSKPLTLSWMILTKYGIVNYAFRGKRKMEVKGRD